MPASRFRALLAAAVVAALTASCWKSAEPPAAAPAKPSVGVAVPLVRKTVTWDRFTGRVQAVRSVEIRARVSGYLDAIHFAEGQIVAEGDPLFTIDPRPYRAALASAQAQKAEAIAGVAQAEATLAQAHAEERAATSVEALARVRLERAERAAKSDAIAGETVDIRASELAQAIAAKEAVIARIAAAEASIATAKAMIATADAAIERAQLDVTFTDIRAPITGRIGQRFVHEGNLVQGGAAGTTLLTTIVSTDPIHCVFEANEQEFLAYTRLALSGERQSSRAVKNPVLLALQDEKGYPHTGHMDFVDNQLDPNSGTMSGRAIFPNADGVLHPGMFATVRLQRSASRDFILVPDEAILTDQSDRLVYVVGDGDVVERRVVVLGPIVDGLRAIESGLDPATRVVIRGLQRVRPGTAVTPTVESLESWLVDDGLPDEATPVPKERWLSIDATQQDGAPRPEKER